MNSNNNNYINITMISDENYILSSVVLLYSLKENKNNFSKYNIYIICTCENLKLKKEIDKLNSTDFNIKLINYSTKEFENYSKTFEEHHVTTAALIKFVLPQLISTDKVLYLDTDILVQKDLYELYNIDIDNYYCAGVKEILADEYATNIGISPYINSGMLLLNLDLLRKDNVTEKLIEAKKNSPKEWVYQDQDVINFIFKDKIKFINIKYNNVCLLYSFKKNSIEQINFKYNMKLSSLKKLNKISTILHFAGRYKPWEYNCGELSKLYFKYLNKTSFKGKYMLRKIDIKQKEKVISISTEKRNNDKVKHFIISLFGLKIKFNAKLIELIFSCKNESKNNKTFKVFTILGIKIKYRINNNDINELKTLIKNQELKINALLYRNIFTDNSQQSEWLKDKSFCLINGAANYSFIYILYKILDFIKPENILEFGLGQTSLLTCQYSDYYKKNLQIIEHNKEWIDIFRTSLEKYNHHKIIQKDLTEVVINGINSDKYGDLDNIVNNIRYDLIIIDGPIGLGKIYPRTNILDLIPNNLNNEFIIILDDAERIGETNTANLIFEKLRENNIEYVISYKTALKTQLVITSPNYNFIHWY